jgi:outer membrane protein assembly factor BamB
MNPTALNQSRRKLCLALGATPLAGLVAGCASPGKPPDLPDLAAVQKNRARVRWSRSTGRAGYGFQPIAIDGKLWAASATGEIVSLDVDTGRQLTGIDTNLELSSGVGTDGSIVVVCDAEGQLHGYNADGESAWKVELNAQAASVPAVGGGVVVIRLSDNSVGCFDLADGSVRWRYTRRNPRLVLRQTSLIAIDPDAAYVGFPGGRIVSLALGTGASRWESGISLPRGANEIERVSDIVGSPVILGQNLCAAAYQGRVTCLDRATGRALWSKNMNAASGTDVNANRIVVADVQGTIYAYDARGDLAWDQRALVGRQLGPPRLAAGRLWVGDANGVVHVLDAENGEVIGRAETDGTQIFVAPLPVIAGTQTDINIIVQTAGGTIASVSA